MHDGMPYFPIQGQHCWR